VFQADDRVEEAREWVILGMGSMGRRGSAPCGDTAAATGVTDDEDCE